MLQESWDSFSWSRDDVFLSNKCKNIRTQERTALDMQIPFFVQGLAQGCLKRAAA